MKRMFSSRYRIFSFYKHVKPKWPLVILLFSSISLFSVSAEDTLLSRGEKLFLENRMTEALPILETAVLQDPGNERVYLYIGTIYEQFGQYDKAVDILQKGVRVADKFLDLVYFNIGNNLFKQQKHNLADEMYTQTIGVNAMFADAYLNRANTRVNIGEYAGAVTDYIVYLNMNPDTSQRGNIEKIIALLGGEIEADRARIRDENERLAAEEARQKALLDDVLNSLQKAMDETKNLSAESEGIENVREEADIVD